MAASNDEWSCDSNKAVRVSLVRPDPPQSDLKVLHEFHPKFTYPIFGKEERIFGYDGLDIKIRFAAHNCEPNVTIKYDKKFNKVGDVRPTDCSGILHEFMPETAFDNRFKDNLKNDQMARSWIPPGTKIHSYERNGRNFEIWSGLLTDINVRNQLDQMQIFILFFIEGGQMLNLDDPDWTLDRWQVYFIYEKASVPDATNVSPYVICGYATTYRCWTLSLPKGHSTEISLQTFPPTEKINLTRQNCRLRISQVVILPPFQRGGHGSSLYQQIYKHVMADDTISELTVEDPSEEFDVLRDINDWKVLEPLFQAADIKINTEAVASKARFEKMPKKKLLDLPLLEKMRKDHKIAPRQFHRCVELYFLGQIPYSHRAAGGASLTKLLVRKHKSPDPIDVKYYWLRNLIKQRIWWQNIDKLQDSSPSEIVEMLNDVTRGQEDEYERYLQRFFEKAVEELNGTQSAIAPSAAIPARKRKIIEEDDDDEGAMSDASKKARNSK